MSIRCDICGEWSAGAGIDHRDICLPCFAHNFSGIQPPLAPGPVPGDHSARDALAAFVDSPQQLTPRQVAAMARLAEAWRRQEG